MSYVTKIQMREYVPIERRKEIEVMMAGLNRIGMKFPKTDEIIERNNNGITYKVNIQSACIDLDKAIRIVTQHIRDTQDSPIIQISRHIPKWKEKLSLLVHLRDKHTEAIAKRLQDQLP